MVQKSKGIFYIILSSVLFGMMPLLARIAYSHNSNAYMVAFLRFAFGSLFLLLWGRKKLFVIKRNELYTFMKLSVPYALTPIFLYLSYNYIDGGTATTLHFTYPIIVMLMMFLIKKTITIRQLICASLAGGGLVLLYSPSSHSSLLGNGIAIFSGFIYAIYIVMLGRSQLKHLSSLVTAFWVSLFSAIEIGGIAFMQGQFTLSFNLEGWLVQILMGLLATTLALMLFQKGLLLCGEIKASMFSTFEPITGLLIGAFFQGEVLSLVEMCGILLILLSVIVLVLPMPQYIRKSA
jgi:drug/metabolite transporter (DMT)-like permease